MSTALCRSLPLCVLLSLGASSLRATNLDLRVLSAGSTSVTVAPGANVDYSVIGELSDSQNQGLALFAFDLGVSGGSLGQADAPTGGPMLNFVPPAGLANPQGFGGTVRNGRLLQVGGAQNTIKSGFAPYPTGTVVTGLGLPGNPVTLVTGSFNAPTLPGVYSLVPSGVVANVVATGATGTPIWQVVPAGTGVVTPLTVQVQVPASDRRRVGPAEAR